MKRFNTTGICIPAKHYMVDISERVREIGKMVDEGEYFVINRARQYGKTTTLKALRQSLNSKYIVLSLSFEGISSAGYRTEGDFIKNFSRLILDQKEFFGVPLPEELCKSLQRFRETDSHELEMGELFQAFRRWLLISSVPVILIIDEIDSASNNQVFLDFLGLLRDSYLAREADGIASFQSVILAGVTDIKHLRSKIREEENSKENSPWNIAADFMIDMSLSEDGIMGMLEAYEADRRTGMDCGFIAKIIRKYTNGYPFLVSRICQILDEKMVPRYSDSLMETWTEGGVETAIKVIRQK